METGTKILLGGAAALGVYFLLGRHLAAIEAKRLAAVTPPGGPIPLLLPVSQNVVSRSPDPPVNATVPPGSFVATFAGQFRLSTANDERNGTAIGPVPVGTLLANVNIFTSRALQ